MIPDTLGWGTVSIEASFGLLRLCFVLASVQCALVVNSSLFSLWSSKSMLKVWEDFMAIPLVSARKALYVLLAVQVHGQPDFYLLHTHACMRAYMYLRLMIVRKSVTLDKFVHCSAPALLPHGGHGG